MANQLFTFPFPYGVDNTQRAMLVRGNLALCGSSVTTGEPINWGNILAGIVYNKVNFVGNGVNGNATALVTGLAANAGAITVTAAHNFAIGQVVTFKNCVTALGAKLNNLSFAVVTIPSPGATFTITTAITDSTTSSETGMAISGTSTRTLSCPGPIINATVTSLAASVASGGVPAYITVTAANNFLPGATITFSGLATTLGLKMNGVQFSVVSSTGTAFVVYSKLTGSAGADSGTATGQNCPQPAQVRFWSGLSSGYEYLYNGTTGVLYVFSGTSGTLVGTLTAPALTMDSYTPAGTNTAPTITTTTGAPATAPIGVILGALAQTVGATGITGVQAPSFTGTAHVLTGSVAAPVLSGSSVSAGPLAALGAAAYPAGVLGDVIEFEATFIKQV